MSLRNLLKISRKFSTKTIEKHVQVCILGADTTLGQNLALLLKQNPAISSLHLQGTSKVETMNLDLSQFDTRVTVNSYFDLESVSKSVKGADIIVMLGLSTCPHKLSLAKLVLAEGIRIAKLAEVCAKFAPKAIVLVAAPPVSVTLPIVAEMYRKTDWYHPGRLLGSSALPQIKANALAGRYQTLDPNIVHVPIVGGPDIDCALPLFSQTTPAGISQKDSQLLFKEFRKEKLHPIVSHAIGINRMIGEIARGINGDFNANTLAYVRTNLIGTCSHLTCLVKIGKSGVIHNYGLQKLNRCELTMFEEICFELKTREKMANDLIKTKDKTELPAFMIEEMEKEKANKQGIIR